MSAAGRSVSGGATAAPAAAQVTGLQDTFIVIVGLIGVAFLVAGWALLRKQPLGRTA